MTPFFDTNIVVYAFLDVAKRDRALDVIASGGVISAQGAERIHQCRAPQAPTRLGRHRARGFGHSHRFPDIKPLTADTHADALDLVRDHGLAFYDALIVATTIEAGCDTLYTEDMLHGRAIGGLAIVNPFLESAR